MQVKGVEEKDWTGSSTKRMGKLGYGNEKAGISAAYLCGVINFIPALRISFRIANV